MQSRSASMTTRDKLDPSLTGRIRISTVISYASMTVPQIHIGIAVILYNVYQCGTSARMLHEQTRRLQRNELARLYHWK
jgi:hypothetical protein